MSNGQGKTVIITGSSSGSARPPPGRLPPPCALDGIAVSARRPGRSLNPHRWNRADVGERGPARDHCGTTPATPAADRNSGAHPVALRVVGLAAVSPANDKPVRDMLMPPDRHGRLSRDGTRLADLVDRRHARRSRTVAPAEASGAAGSSAGRRADVIAAPRLPGGVCFCVSDGFFSIDTETMEVIVTGRRVDITYRSRPGHGPVEPPITASVSSPTFLSARSAGSRAERSPLLSFTLITNGRRAV
ncbi:hypothetical protein UA75_16130 [Actinoalloteichus sp. GBA129-24]|nr:hypothetical protein UA75_16130 [Actinoalloteichus sp. GBA129-24]